MTRNPEYKVGDDHPQDQGRPLSFIPGLDKRQLKRILGLEDDEDDHEAPPNPQRQEPL